MIIGRPSDYPLSLKVTSVAEGLEYTGGRLIDYCQDGSKMIDYCQERSGS